MPEENVKQTEILESIAEAVLDGSSASTVARVKEACALGVRADVIFKGGLMWGMNEVGILFKEGEMFVPEVLVSAKALQAGIEIIKPALMSCGVKAAGKVLTVTVEGDLHDIGIKLVGMMLEGAGFEVINMGVDKPAAAIAEEVKKIRPDILGMSAMLTTTMTNMQEVIDLLKKEGMDGVKIMIGGAPTSAAFAQKLGAHYSSDAMEAVNTAKSILGI